MIKNNKFILLGITSSFLFAVAFFVAPVIVKAADYTPITGTATLRVGSRGADVVSLQKLLASSPDMYPSQSQDGRFGPNTRNGVIQFQLAYNLNPDGAVGPKTRNVVNSVVSDGRGIDVSNAGIYNLLVTSSGRNETVTFNTSEPVKATVFYDTAPINWDNWNDEIMSMSTPTISGTANTDNTFTTSKQFTLTNLSPNTKYNYTITTTDQSGNVSVIWPTTFNSAQ